MKETTKLAQGGVVEVPRVDVRCDEDRIVENEITAARIVAPYAAAGRKRRRASEQASERAEGLLAPELLVDPPALLIDARHEESHLEGAGGWSCS